MLLPEKIDDLAWGEIAREWAKMRRINLIPNDHGSLAHLLRDSYLRGRETREPSEPLHPRWAKNDWDFDPKSDQVDEFGRIVMSRLSAVEQRMLLCLVESEDGLTYLKNMLYK